MNDDNDDGLVNRIRFSAKGKWPAERTAVSTSKIIINGKEYTHLDKVDDVGRAQIEADAALAELLCVEEQALLLREANTNAERRVREAQKRSGNNKEARQHSAAGDRDTKRTSHSIAVPIVANRDAGKSSPLSNHGAQHTTKASSQLPKSSYLFKVLDKKNIGSPDDDPSDSDGSDSDTISEPSSVDSSDLKSTKHEKKLRKKQYCKQRERRKRDLTNDKPVLPSIYNGDAKIDVFQCWLYSVMDYFKAAHVNGKYCIPCLQHFMSGKAAAFFMREVAMTTRRWELDEFSTNLFDYCFPENFHTGQRVRLTECRQNTRPVHDWTFELRSLADSVGDVPDRQLVLYLWQGSDTYRKKWAEQPRNIFV